MESDVAGLHTNVLGHRAPGLVVAVDREREEDVDQQHILMPHFGHNAVETATISANCRAASTRVAQTTRYGTTAVVFVQTGEGGKTGSERCRRHC